MFPSALAFASALLALSATTPALAAALPRATTPLPDYVLQFAPLSHLFSDETFFPSDIATHLQHVTPEDGTDPVAGSVTFQTIGGLGSDIFLTSKDDPLASPQASWLLGNGQPDATGFTTAPATIIAVEKPGGILDAFYFYFYSFNEAQASIILAPVSHLRTNISYTVSRHHLRRPRW